MYIWGLIRQGIRYTDKLNVQELRTQILKNHNEHRRKKSFFLFESFFFSENDKTTILKSGGEINHAVDDSVSSELKFCWYGYEKIYTCLQSIIEGEGNSIETATHMSSVGFQSVISRLQVVKGTSKNYLLSNSVKRVMRQDLFVR